MDGIPQIFAYEASLVEVEEAQRRNDDLRQLLEAPLDDTTRISAANMLEKAGRLDEALLLLQEGTKLPGASVQLHHRYIDLLGECNRTSEAIAFAGETSRRFPDDVLSKMKEALLLPVVYESTKELWEYRGRYRTGLSKLCVAIQLDAPQQRARALAALGDHTNVYLGYQGENDRDPQVQYGQLAYRIVAANYPQWTVALQMPAADTGEPLRVGYVSSRFRDLSATRFFLGWLRGHDRKRFTIHSWYVRAKADRFTDEVRAASEVFHHLYGSLEEICESIRGCQLHALVFLDIGIDPRMTQLAAMRLAPVQCMAWDQPITSGLPTIDYALSGDLAEAGQAEAHYSEQLVRLPGVGVSYPRPLIPWPLLVKTRSDFHLRDDAMVYLCCQPAYKFLPENDSILVEIARRVPLAQFVFIVNNAMVEADFQRRLGRAFARAGLAAERHCVVLPQLKHLDYWNLHRVADIFLDTIGWSSGGSVFEAVACRVPVVTIPGELMRSRQGYAILSQLGVTDTIARDGNHYVEIAVRLAEDLSFREDLVGRMVLGFPGLYSDNRGVGALEEFLIKAIRKQASR